MESINKINIQIAGLTGFDQTNKISDTYHTFGELYEHRVTLYILLCKLLQEKGYYVWRSKFHGDGTCIEGMFVLGLNDEAGKQISYHMEIDKYWSETRFADQPENIPIYDNHTSEDVLVRLLDIIHET